MTFDIVMMIAFIIFFVLLLVFTLIVFWLWALIDCLTSRLSVPEKIIWTILIIVFNIFGALLYVILSKIVGERIMAKKDFKGKKLLRSKSNRVIAGVCGGLGEYLKVDPTIVRLIWVLLTVISVGGGIIAYLIAWIIIPEK